MQTKWIQLCSDRLNENRRKISQQHLERYDNEGEDFLGRIVTGDETWVHHFEPESKHQTMTWKHPDSPVPKKFKTRLSAGKLMLTVFSDSRGLFLNITPNVDQRSPVTDIVRCCVTIFDQQFVLGDVDYCRAVSYCCTIMHAPIRRQRLWKLFKIFVSRFYILLIVRPRPFRFPSLRTPKRSIAMASVLKWWRGEAGGAGVAAFHARILLLWRDTAASSSLEQACGTRGWLCWKMIRYFCCNCKIYHYRNKNANNFWLIFVLFTIFFLK